MTARAAYANLVPDGLKALAGVYGYVSRSVLPTPLLDLVFLRASQINGCAYCIDLHTRDALKQGAPIERLMLLSAWREGGAHFSDRERAALAWTEIVTQVATTHVPDDAYDDARTAFSERELADLTLAIGVINTYNRLAIAFRRPPDSLVLIHAGGD